MKSTDKFALALSLALILLSGVPALAQVQVGDKLNMSANGVASAGYTGNYGNLGGASDHGITLGGSGSVNGSYFNPNFLSFNIAPYYNQSRANSAYQSVSNSSGADASVNIFSGSRFPGSIAYSKSYDSSGNFAVPGVADYTTHGNTDTLSVGWAVNLDNFPALSFNFLEGNSAYTVYGANSTSGSAFHAFNAHTNYRIAGFNLSGGFGTTASQAKSPQFLTGQPAETSDSSGHNYSFGVGHALPLAGSLSGSFTRSYINTGYGAASTSGTLDTMSANAGFNPFPRFSFSTNVTYTDNLAATLEQTLLAAGGIVPIDISQKSNSLDMAGYAGYSVPELHLTLMVNADHRTQTYEGFTTGNESYTGSVSTNRTLLGGRVNAVMGLNRTTLDINGQSTTGLFGTLGLFRKIGAWDFSSSVNYAQGTQTALIGYTNTSYGLTGSAGRSIGKRLSWSTNASVSKSQASGASGNTSESQSYSTSLASRWLTGSGSYSESTGNSILTGSGLVSVPTNIPVLAAGQLILYGGHAYSVGMGSNPRRGVTLSGSYSKAFSNTVGGATNSNNSVENLNTMLQYKFRKMWFTAGYSKLTQGFSATGVPVTVGSFYGGISRWFNLF